MASVSDWRSALAATARYENIASLKTRMEARGVASTGNSHKAAFAAETEAYNNSDSREAYEAACNALFASAASTTSTQLPPEPASPGIPIGSYASCHQSASGLVSTVYRSGIHALKVITETRDVEPHNPIREVAILRSLSHSNIITLQSTFRDQHSNLVLVFPFLPLTLASVLATGTVTIALTQAIFKDLLSALTYLHAQGIIHRDIKPSNLLLASSRGPATLIDFGTAYHPTLSLTIPPNEPASLKYIEVGTTAYRAPETLFGYRSYGTSLDLWSTGVMLAECLRQPHKSLFESRETHEDGNQLGLILSMFKTLGTPTPEKWPEAESFSTPPFRWYSMFPGKSWKELLPEVDEDGRHLVEALVKWEGGDRLSAEQALKHPFFEDS